MEYITKESAIKAIQGLCIEENTPQMIWSTDAMDAVRNATNGWISVKDRMPEVAGMKVFVAAKTVKENIIQSQTVFTAFCGYGDQKWYTLDNGYMTSPIIGNNEVHPTWEITHWMPLPEPPKE